MDIDYSKWRPLTNEEIAKYYTPAVVAAYGSPDDHLNSIKCGKVNGEYVVATAEVEDFVPNHEVPFYVWQSAIKHFANVIENPVLG